MRKRILLMRDLDTLPGALHASERFDGLEEALT
jgi:hypothetical protein